EQLAPAVEQLSQSHLSQRAVENILLLHPDPRQGPLPGGHGVVLPCELLLPGQQLPASGEPLVLRNDLVGHGGGSAWRTHDDFSLGLRSSDRRASEILAAVLRWRRILSAAAVTPPVEMAPVTRSARLAKHSGHMGGL